MTKSKHYRQLYYFWTPFCFSKSLNIEQIGLKLEIYQNHKRYNIYRTQLTLNFQIYVISVVSTRNLTCFKHKLSKKYMQSFTGIGTTYWNVRCILTKDNELFHTYDTPCPYLTWIQSNTCFYFIKETCLWTY